MIDNKFNLGFFPTPLHKLRKLSKIYPDYTIFIKRDDQTGLASGGNKTRKLEYLIKQALDEGCDTIITAGAQQSNHCRQTAAACALAGLKCHLLLGGIKPEVYDGNLLLSSILGAAIHFTGENRKGEDVEILKKKLENKGRKCFVIPYGGSNFTGAMGFVNAVKEVKEQLIEQKLKIDYIFFASSSGGTQAGLILGKEIYQLQSEFIAINIDKDETKGVSLEEVVENIVQEGLQKLNIDKKIQLSDIYLNRDYDKEGYGIVTNNEINVIKELAKNEGILLDPVYTGRAFYGMLDFLKRKRIPTNTNVLFWHTGGLPALFKYANELK
ncbi:D-cysteine desulfhydrase family protein [Dokdonia ponticola]|uniref:D-cysteine desulfhydrase family protein n=1 Tax=Dokdonia ponticola TaxID=2041041 RepID=A0ABV9HSW0_9FLAO